MSCALLRLFMGICRAPRGARGLKFQPVVWGSRRQSRAPRGARGLKSDVDNVSPAEDLSRPSRGAWIEISCHLFHRDLCGVAPLAGRVD